MNPLAGGQLGKTIPVFRELATRAGCETMVEAALRFVISQSGAVTALNGITFGEQATQGTEAILKGALPVEIQEPLLTELGELYATIPGNRLCTQCRYCGECPEGILIPEVLEQYTYLQIERMKSAAQVQIREMRAADPVGYQPAQCRACRQCEEKCPNRLPISDMMAHAASLWPV
jgi:predicted aldo/keto reductase-like oxidoreductase